MYIKRNVENSILSVAKSFPCIAIYGPRQVGKSTTTEHLFGKNMKSVSLDDAEIRSLAHANPRLFLEGYGWPLAIDEIQKVPELLDAVKVNIDAQRLLWLDNGEERKLMYVLTGSNRFELQQGISESLAGRCGIIDMFSFSQAEKLGTDAPLFVPEISQIKERGESLRTYKTRTEIFDEIFMGGMPDICTGNAERTAYFKAYVSTYIEKDILKLIAAPSEMQFRNFLTLTALRTAQELHYDELAGACGIDVRTCKRWISILQTSGIIHLLHPYFPNASSRIIKAPKIYFMDTGLCAYLCNVTNAEMLGSSMLCGPFFETFAVSEIIKNLSSHNIDPDDRLFYYRDNAGKEIDLLYVDAGNIYPIEIKSSIMPSKPTKNFDVLKKYNLNIRQGLVIDCSKDVAPVNEAAWHLPIYLI